MTNEKVYYKGRFTDVNNEQNTYRTATYNKWHNNDKCWLFHFDAYFICRKRLHDGLSGSTPGGWIDYTTKLVCHSI